MSDPLEKAEDGDAPATPDRKANGRFLPGHKLAGPGNAGARVNLAAIAKRKAKEKGLDIEALVWDVLYSMLIMGACGDTKAAKVAFDALGEVEAKGPLVNIDATGTGGRVPQAPPFVAAGVDGAPSLGEHMARLAAIIEERGLATLAGATPAKVVEIIAHRTAEEELLS